MLDVPDYLWPTPSLIVSSLVDNASEIGSDTWVTIREVIYGFLIAVAAGLGIGIALHLSGLLRRAVLPLLIASQSIPTVVLAPVLVLVMGFGIGPKLAIIALFCFFPIVVNTVDGLSSVDREYIRMMLTLDASRMAIFRRIEFPSALPADLLREPASRPPTPRSERCSASGPAPRRGLVFACSRRRVVSTPLTCSPPFSIVTLIAVAVFLLVTLIERLTIPWAKT